MELTIKDSVRRFVLLKLTTDRHEASRGLFATAELLVCVNTSVSTDPSSCAVAKRPREASCYVRYDIVITCLNSLLTD